MPYSSDNGQYGGMPMASLRNKYEVTSMGDDTNLAVSELMRDGLRDTSCSATFFESDHKREDTGSEERLSLRFNGHRSGETPHAPDLFLELTGRDPRGTATGPDMQKIRDMAWDRRDSHKFYSDSDNTITDRAKHPSVLQEQLRDQFEITKRRLKIFSTSRDQATTGSSVTTRGDSRPDQEDQTAMNTRDEILTALRKQSAQQGELQLGWEQTSDLEIKVASLGQIRSGMAVADSEGNRHNVGSGQLMMDSTQQILKTGSANLMKAVIDRLAGLQTDQIFASSTGLASTGSGRCGPDERSRTATTGLDTAKREVAFGTVSRFIGQLNSQSGMSGQDIETQIHVIQFMDNALTASVASRESRFAAEDIVLSAKTASAFADNNVVRALASVDSLSSRNVSETSKKFDSMTIARLGRTSMTKGKRIDGITGESYKSQSDINTQKRLAPQVIRDSYANAESQGHNTFSTKSRSIRGMGSKFTRDKMDTDRTLNAMSDMS